MNPEIPEYADETTFISHIQEFNDQGIMTTKQKRKDGVLALISSCFCLALYFVIYV